MTLLYMYMYMYMHYNNEYMRKLSLPLCPHMSFHADPLVLHLQFIHDGHLPCWSCQHDHDENTAERLRQI